MNNQIIIICCPPFSQYPTAPEDHSHSELFYCPKCKNKMWLSRKKKGVILFAACSMKDILLSCYDCFRKMVKEDSSLLINAEEMKL